MSQETLAVTKTALIKRINRKLAHQAETLKVTRGERWRGELGDYYTVSDSNWITGKHVEPEQLARELGVLRVGEALA